MSTIANNVGRLDKEMTRERRLCPFIERHYEECYSTDMDSRKVEEAIYYCGGNYEECEIYKERVMDKGMAKGNGG